MPYTVILDIAARSGANWLNGIPLDVFAPQFETTARKIAERNVRRTLRTRTSSATSVTMSCVGGRTGAVNRICSRCI